MYVALQSSSENKKTKVVSESSWLRNESIRYVMLNVVSAQGLLFVVMVLMLILLYGQASTPLLLAWFGTNCLLSLLRMWFLQGYSRNDHADQYRQRIHYFILYAKLAPFNGLIWGLSVYLFNNTASPNIAIFCLIIVLVFGMFSVSNLSSHLRLMHWFIASYGAGLMLSILAHIAIDQNFAPDTTQLWFVGMVFIFVFLLYRFGNRLNTAYTRALALQFRNSALIASLTEQREAALSAVATKNRMLASAAHDMRQPVLALDLYAGWLIDEPAASPELAPKIAASTKAVIGLFDSMFDMSRLTEGQISTNLTSVKLYDLFEDLYVQYQPIAWAKHLTLRTRVIDGEVFTDALLLERILGNLLSNAIKYTQTGSILLACRNTSQGVRIEVWDTGVGIALEQQSLVFREFYKGTANVGTTDGFGLGLAIVTQLSDLLGYALALKSRPGRGTVVSIQLGKLL
jgi:signal transduction histidine kinase